MQLYQVNICGVSSHAADLSVAAVCLTWKVTWTSWVLLGFCLWLCFMVSWWCTSGLLLGGLAFTFLGSVHLFLPPVILIFLLSLRLFSLMMWIVRTQSVDVEPGQCLPSGCYTLELHSGCHRRWIVGQTVASLHIFPYQDQTSFISVVGEACLLPPPLVLPLLLLLAHYLVLLLLRDHGARVMVFFWGPSELQ